MPGAPGRTKMASTRLRGPFSLSLEGIKNAVSATLPGAYALGHTDERGSFVVEYVGRGDDDVRKSLQRHVVENYRQFEFAYYDRAKDAFEKECNLYHDFPNTNNRAHPAGPPGSCWMCPRCTVFDPFSLCACPSVVALR